MSAYDPNYVPVESYFMIIVKAVLYDKDGNILLLKRSEKSPRPLGWDFPGGGADKGEDPVTAIKREIIEETNLNVEKLTLLNTFYGKIRDEDYVSIGYCGLIEKSDIKLSWEHSAYKWVSLDQAKQIELPELHSELLGSFVKNYITNKI